MSPDEEVTPCPVRPYGLGRLGTAGVIALALVCFVTGLQLGRRMIRLPSPRAATLAPPPEFQVFWEAWRVIERQYLDSATLDHAVMIRGALRGMLAALGDRYTIYVEPAEHQQITASFVGSAGDGAVSYRLLGDGIGYVQVLRFDERTASQLDQGIQALGAQGARALVLDLQGNGGGLLQAVPEFLGRFVDCGVAFREIQANGHERRYAVTFASDRTSWPLAVLIDRSTASAAEMVAAAIQDCGRGMVVGERTRGKGTVQTVFELADGSAVHVTTARWSSSSGRSLDGVGVEPDRLLDLGDGSSSDAALIVAVEHLKQVLRTLPHQGNWTPN